MCEKGCVRRAVREGLCEKDGTTVCECVSMEEYVNVSEWKSM